MNRVLSVVAFMVASSLLCAGAKAQDAEEGEGPGVIREAEMGDEAARGHFDVGQTLFRVGRYEDAAREFEEAYALSGRSSLLFNAYLAYRDAGDVENAVRVLEQFLAAEPDDPDFDRLEVRLHALQLTLERQRLAALTASTQAEHQAALAEAERLRLEAETARLEAERGRIEEEAEQLRQENNANHGPMWVIGGGGALLLGSGVSALITMSRRNDIESNCPNDVCPPEYELDESKGEVRAAAIATDVLLFTGIATLGAGLAWYFIDKRRGDEDRPISATGGCGLQGCNVNVEVSF